MGARDSLLPVPLKTRRSSSWCSTARAKVPQGKGLLDNSNSLFVRPGHDRRSTVGCLAMCGRRLGAALLAHRPSMSFDGRSGPDEATKKVVSKLPMLTVKAGPRDGEEWVKRMKEEYMALIQARS
jgi:hypothetical protein